MSYLLVVSSQVLLQVADFCQSSTMAIAFFGFLPQLRTIYINKSSKNISLKAWSLWTLSAILGLFYALVQYHVHGNCLVLVLSALTGVFLNIIALSMATYYRERPIRAVADAMQMAIGSIEQTNREIAQELDGLNELAEQEKPSQEIVSVPLS